MQRTVQTIEDVQRGGHTLYAICRNDGCRYVSKVDLPLLLRRVTPTTPLLPGRHERHFTDSMRCSSCRWRGVRLWVEPAEQKRQILQRSAAPKLPNYEIRDWGRDYPFTSSVTIATADNLFVGRGSYIAAAGFYFDRRITLQQGAFVIIDSKKDDPPAVKTLQDFKNLRAVESGTLSIEELNAITSKSARPS